MRKSGFFTLCWAFIPGAGQMYQGYMRRGLSIIGIFCFGVFLTACVGILAVVLPVVYMYSFFDTLNLHEQIRQGTNPPDDYLVHLGLQNGLGMLLQRRHNLFGWLLVALGGMMLYENFLSPWLWQLSYAFPQLSFLTDLLRSLPNLALALALIWLGLWLVRGGRKGGPDAPDASGTGGAGGAGGMPPAPWDEEE